MINAEYIAGALRTEAPVTSPEVKARVAVAATLHFFSLVLNQAIDAGNVMDAYKKYFYYGRSLPVTQVDGYSVSPSITGRLSNANTLRLLHSAIGLFTESAELLLALRDHIFEGSDLDLVNFIEEFGDSFWYLGIGADALHVSFETIMERNNAKLRARYPEKFTERDANVRTISRERAVLEGDKTKDRLGWGSGLPDGHGSWAADTANGLLAYIRHFDRESGFIYGSLAHTHGTVECTWSYRDGSHISPAPSAEWNLQLDTIAAVPQTEG